MKPKIVVKDQEIISYGFSDYSISGTQELIEIEKENWPEDARKKDVYWDGSKVKLKTQVMINDENNIEKDKEDKEKLDNKIIKNLAELLDQMINTSGPYDFNTLIENLKTEME